MECILSSFGLVALSEMGDKTQLLALLLASRFKKPWAIIAGIFFATVLNHALASSIGAWVSAQVPPYAMALILGVFFLSFGVWTLIPDKLEDETTPPRFGAFLTTTILFFLAEIGDKTQLATVALAAQFQDAVKVTLGTTMGMLLTDGLAVFLGHKITRVVPMNWIRVLAATCFFGFGFYSFYVAYDSWQTLSSLLRK